MALSDIFIRASNQQAAEQTANLERQQREYQARLDARRAAGTITEAQYSVGLQAIENSRPLDQDAAAAAGFIEGAREGLDNVTGAVNRTLAGTVNAVFSSIPWQIWALGAVALFVWMGGHLWLKNILPKKI
jgi:multidrug efflux pump subunit AcrA (membrane-fusion protein)